MYEELIKALHGWNVYGQHLERCNCELAAADAIESLTEQVAALQSENAEKDKEIERLKAYEALYRELTDKGLKTGQALLEKLSRVEEERDAAVKDMKLMADKDREEHGDEVPCFACRFDECVSLLPSGDFSGECPGFHKDDCFEWRGAQREE